MADMTPTQAFAICAASTEKTNLIADFDAVLTGLDDAATAGAFSTVVRDQLKNEVVDVAERIATCMRDHS